MMLPNKKKHKRTATHGLSFFLVDPKVFFSHQSLEELEKLWNLRHLIPDPS